ncbi:hypothetical protein LCGC14_2335090, partial [marine sediment metagenome]
INGGVFAETLSIPSFDSDMRNCLLSACKFDWSSISPAIFGALFQSVLDPDERRRLGGHYTSEENIQKVLDCLFLSDLRQELDEILASRSKQESRLRLMQTKLGKLNFLDPACGCGNFLAIAYRELRLLELRILVELNRTGTLDLESSDLSVVDVDQFYGIEIREYSARIAETAMWMIDHVANVHLSLELGTVYQRVPLIKSPLIVIADALSHDWTAVLPSDQCAFVFGNPPYGGSKRQTSEQRQIIASLVSSTGVSGTLDYVAGWFIKAAAYVQETGRIGFVATNSIIQGEQAGQLWPLLFERHRLELSFAHQTFAWHSSGSGGANVHVVIIGLDKAKFERTEKLLFQYPDINGHGVGMLVEKISPYLIMANDLLNTAVHRYR